MSQPASFGFPLSGPLSPSAVATRADDSLAALLSMNSGVSPPAYAVLGTQWADTSVAGVIVKNVYDGANWVVEDVIDTATGISRTFADIHPFEDLASASTVDIGAASSRNVRITGTTTISSFDTAPAGTMRKLRFSGALTLTHSANLLLPGSANLTTVANDVLDAVSLGGGVWLATQLTQASVAAERARLGATTVGAALLMAADQAAARVAINSPALPQAGAGPGQVVQIGTPPGNGYSLPSGGTWSWFFFGIDSTSNTIAAGITAGVSAGGATLTGGVSNVIWSGVAWRVS